MGKDAIAEYAKRIAEEAVKDYTAVDAVKVAEKIIRGLHDGLDDLEMIAADPVLTAEQKVESMLELIKEVRDAALRGS